MKEFFAKLGFAIAASVSWIARTIRALAASVRTNAARAVRSKFARATGRFTLRTARIAVLTALITAATLFAGWVGFERVEAGTIGVKQVNFGGGGIVSEDYPSGLHFGIKGFHSWHQIDGRTQMISYGWSSEPADAEHLKVRTADGNYVRIGLAVPFRVIRGEAHRLVEDGLKSTYRKRVQTSIEKILTTEFGRLTTEQFWDTALRTDCIATALPKLNRELSSLHVEALDILVENFRFNPEYEDRLQQVQLGAVKKIVDQTKAAVDVEQRKIDAALREIERADNDLTLELKQEIDAANDAGRKRIEAKLAEARYYDQTRKARATAEYESLVAQGERQVSQVEQLRIAAENEGYSSRGGRLLLARLAAENLKIKQVTLNSNDPKSPSVLDIDSLVALLVGGAK
jgi:hypothetical protein